MYLKARIYCEMFLSHGLFHIILRQFHFINYHKMGIPEFLDSGRKSWTLDSGRWTLDARLWTLGSGCWTLDAGLWTLTLNPGRWTLYAGLWKLNSGPWMLGSGCWTVDSWCWTLGSGHGTLSLTVLKQNQQPVSDSAWLNYWKFSRCESLRNLWSRLLYRDYRFWFFYS